MSKKNKQYQLWVGLGLLLVVIILTVAIVNAMKEESTGDIVVGGGAKVTGLVCKDTTSVHPATASVSAVSHANTITANFRDGKLASISLLYEGNYGTEKSAESAEAFARADYNETLAKKYSEKIDIFSVDYLVDGAKMQIVQTARDISKVNSNTVTYFLLDQGTSISKTLDGLKKQYENKGFSCEISK